MGFKLHNFYMNSAGRRVRTVLHLKNIPFDYVSVDISPASEAQLGDAYGKINPMRLIPTLEHDGVLLTESLAICDYLEELYPTPSLYPADRMERAHAKAIAMTVAAAIHPLHNTRVMKYLGQSLHLDQKASAEWYVHWADKGLHALEALIERAEQSRQEDGPFVFGKVPSIADIFILPQIENYKKLGLNLEPYARVCRVVDACNIHPAFIKAAPENQPDFPSP
ncbi:MAG: maleylacetoacetate isomerase [Alphaproteobacteria bacterium]|mgnify:FL=1|nr:maleylacetoacetate isomerase [Alphaproteobacteria bacterium]MBO6626894.1 maleylacetoacetate isomerase [Alphaproteobacteria bacterium]MDF1627661.1 maleylacetoacetate isomerase [Parvibaculaceae bacterium]